MSQLKKKSFCVYTKTSFYLETFFQKFVFMLPKRYCQVNLLLNRTRFPLLVENLPLIQLLFWTFPKSVFYDSRDQQNILIHFHRIQGCISEIRHWFIWRTRWYRMCYSDAVTSCGTQGTAEIKLMATRSRRNRRQFRDKSSDKATQGRWT